MARVIYFLTIYNEAGAIPKVLSSLSSVRLSPGISSFVIHAVDDASTDDTPRILKGLMSTYPLEVVRYDENRGVSETFKLGLKHFAKTLSDDDIVILMEADGTSDTAVIPAMLRKILEGNDLVIASRELRGGRYLGFPWYRILGSKGINLFLRTLWRVRGATDYTIFFRAYRVSLLKKCFTADFEFHARRSFAANGEILLRLKKFNPRIAQVPFVYDYGIKRGPSRMRLVGTLLEYIRLTLRVYL